MSGTVLNRFISRNYLTFMVVSKSVYVICIAFDIRCWVKCDIVITDGDADESERELSAREDHPRSQRPWFPVQLSKDRGTFH